MTRKKEYFVGLNGIRAIAAISVMLTHIHLEHSALGLSKRETIDLGGFGVTIFFALSGFLITHLLLKEKQDIGTIHVGFFYLRRILRIWPLYFLYLIIGIIVLIFKQGEINVSVWYYVFLSGNIPFILGSGLPFISHLWSIGVEEQFYLFWPWLVKKFSSPLNVIFIFGIIFFALRVLFRLIEVYFNYHLPYIAIHVTRFDCMAIGAIGAIILFKNKQRILLWIMRPFVQIASWAPLVLLAFNKFHVASIFDHQLVSICTVLIVINVSSNPLTIISLENKLFNFLGKISYGIYVWHPLVIAFIGLMIRNYKINTFLHELIAYIGVIVFTIFIAWFSYKFIEKPFLKIKEKFNA
jgi:peptidoglycan/LPS O-acetylase OafA/YrhL